MGPWDDETDMDKMLECAKTIEKEGLVWGAHKLVPVGYGIKKLQLMCVVEDEKVSIDELCEQIQEFEDYVQSVDISSMSNLKPHLDYHNTNCFHLKNNHQSKRAKRIICCLI